MLRTCPRTYACTSGCTIVFVHKFISHKHTCGARGVLASKEGSWSMSVGISMKASVVVDIVMRAAALVLFFVIKGVMKGSLVFSRETEIVLQIYYYYS